MVPCSSGCYDFCWEITCQSDGLSFRFDLCSLYFSFQDLLNVWHNERLKYTIYWVSFWSFLLGVLCACCVCVNMFFLNLGKYSTRVEMIIYGIDTGIFIFFYAYKSKIWCLHSTQFIGFFFPGGLWGSVETDVAVNRGECPAEEYWAWGPVVSEIYNEDPFPLWHCWGCLSRCLPFSAFSQMGTLLRTQPSQDPCCSPKFSLVQLPWFCSHLGKLPS